MPTAIAPAPDVMPGSFSAADLTALRAELDRERAARAAAEAEAARLRLTAPIPGRNPNPILRMSLDGQLEYANPAASFLVADIEREGISWTRPQLLDAVAVARRTRHPDYRPLTVGRQQFLLYTVPVPEEQHAMLYLTDVTSLRQVETQVQEQHAFYEAMMDHLPAVMTVLGPDQRYRFINRYAAPDPEQRQARLGTTFAEHAAAVGLPKSMATRRRRLFEQAAKKRVMVAWEEEWPAVEGQSPRYWQCYYHPLYAPGGHLHLMMCYGLDVTVQRQAEARSRASEGAVLAQQRFTSQVLNLNPNLIYVRDNQHHIVFENQALAAFKELIRALAPPLPDQGTRPDTSRAYVEAEELAAYAAVDDEVRHSGEQRQSEDRLTLGNGEVRWFQTMKCPLPTPDGAVHVLGVSTDITALKHAQHAAEAAATARENFLANMSHEIRTPLNGVLGMAGLLAKTGLDEQQRNYVNVIQHSGKHLLGVVNDVLDMAKITSGKLEMERVAFNLCDSINHAVQPLVALGIEKGIRVVGTQLRDSCPYPWVLSDPQRINQILINLVSNAIKFTPAGGSVSVGGHYVGETDDTLTVEFRVTDTGIGIPADKLDTIFQEFTQAYADTARQYGGTGLGLSISRALVRELGGTLTVQSTVGEGSSFAFQVTLPKAPAEARVPAPAAPALDYDVVVRGRHVLLVEDNPVNREVAQLLLEGHGVYVDTAGSGLEALTLFEHTRYDIVLMDIQMPGMNGLDATARIRQHPDAARAATPVLALTANAFRADAEKYRAAGMNDTLAKPFDELELLAKIGALLGVEAPAGPVVPKPAPAPDAPAGPARQFDLSLLHQTAHGNPAFIKRVLSAFHANTPLSLNELWEAIGTENWPAAAAVAHRLRPSLRLFGTATLTPLMAVLEDTNAPDAAREAAAHAFAEGLEALLEVLPAE